MRVRPKKIVWKFRSFIHNILINLGPFSSAMKNMAITCKSCFSSKSRVAQLSSNSCYKNAPYLERCLAFYKIKFAINYCALKKYLEGTTNMKQDRRLNNGLLMQVKNSKVSKQFFVPHNYVKNILGNLSRGIYAWLGVRWAAGPLRLQKAPMPLNWVLRIICIRKGKT